MNDFLMTTDAARFLRKSAEAVRNYERQGKLAATKTANGRRLFRREDLEKFLRERGEKYAPDSAG